MYNNTIWIGVTTEKFILETSELGVIECDGNNYFITGPHINNSIIQALQSKNISY